MQRRKIELKSVTDVKTFVRIVNQFPYDVDLVSGHFVVDAKSIMGIFSLKLDEPIDLEIQHDNASDLLTKLKNFIVD